MQPRQRQSTGGRCMSVLCNLRQQDNSNDSYRILTVTGWPRLPLLAALGKHQSRWNYVDVDDVIQVDRKFDEHRIPYDFIWLDLEHTNQKRYFTWDPKHFPDPGRMLDHLARTSRKLVTIVDPHLMGDDNPLPAR